MKELRSNGSESLEDIKILDRMRRFIYLRDLFSILLMRELKLRYERSILGMLWAVLNPLAQLLVFILVFQRIIPLNIPDYPLFVFIGIVAWNWTREALMLSANAITGNRELIKQPGFPLVLLPCISITMPLIDLLIALPIIVFFLLLGGKSITVAILIFPVLVAVHFLLLQGVGFLLAALQVRFRDTGHLLGVILMLLFYLTPVFYDISNIPLSFRKLLLINPVTHLIKAYRSVLIMGELPDLPAILGLGVVAAALLWIGKAVFKNASWRFVEEL